MYNSSSVFVPVALGWLLQAVTSRSYGRCMLTFKTWSQYFPKGLVGAEDCVECYILANISRCYYCSLCCSDGSVALSHGSLRFVSPVRKGVLVITEFRTEMSPVSHHSPQGLQLWLQEHRRGPSPLPASEASLVRFTFSPSLPPPHLPVSHLSSDAVTSFFTFVDRVWTQQQPMGPEGFLLKVLCSNLRSTWGDVSAGFWSVWFRLMFKSLLANFLNYTVYVWVQERRCAHMCTHVCKRLCVRLRVKHRHEWRSEDNWGELGLSFPHVGPWDNAQVVSLGGRHLYLVTGLTSLKPLQIPGFPGTTRLREYFLTELLWHTSHKALG